MGFGWLWDPWSFQHFDHALAVQPDGDGPLCQVEGVTQAFLHGQDAADPPVCFGKRTGLV